jgi:DNA-binding transcriptional regulator GbsR (MarR family)
MKNLNDPKLKFIEETGSLIEKKGYSPIVSRILSFLLIADTEEKNFYEIQESLDASKSAISNGISFLLDKNFIKTNTYPGDRKRYFRLNTEMWIEVLRSMTEEYKGYRIAIEKALELRSDKFTESNSQLVKIRDLYQLIEAKLPLILSEWETKNAIQIERL